MVMSWACLFVRCCPEVTRKKGKITDRLVVSEAKGGSVLVLEGKLLKVLDDLGELGKDEIQGALLEDQVGVVGDCEAPTFSTGLHWQNRGSFSRNKGCGIMRTLQPLFQQ